MNAKKFIIIGASSGIGLALTKQLLESGASVFATRLQKEIPFEHPKLQWFKYDAIESEWPLENTNLDGLVYCPGTIVLKPFKRLSSTDFLTDYNLQVSGAVRAIQAAVPSLLQSTQASIVLFSSVAAQQGLPFHSMVSASKGAIEGLTRALAAEFAPKIRVNAIAPSLTDTPLAENLLNTDAKRDANAARHPLRRIGQTGDLAAMAHFLLDEKSSWISGQVLAVDGGISTLRI
ncbi:MAG: hypothetical protein RLZZ301_491 [Bacteroidota bacterium]|jgi:NAD(P)-dependent dehydrogenase (short-subunit alcohol dehydrogenase family)